ncbi:unnamed protein product [Lampetra fluviatilis]
MSTLSNLRASAPALSKPLLSRSAATSPTNQPPPSGACGKRSAPIGRIRGEGWGQGFPSPTPPPTLRNQPIGGRHAPSQSRGHVWFPF